MTAQVATEHKCFNLRVGLREIRCNNYIDDRKCNGLLLKIDGDISPGRIEIKCRKCKFTHKFTWKI